MAGKGTYGAFIPIKGIGTQIQDTLTQTENAGFRYREEEALKKQRRETQLKEMAANMRVDLDKLTFDETQIASIDSPMYEYYNQSKEVIVNLYTALKADPEDFKSRIKLEKVLSSAKMMKGFTDRYKGFQKDFADGLKSGKYSEFLNADYPEKISTALLQGKYKLLNDDNGDLQIFVDLDGDGVNDQEFTSINVAEFLNGNTSYTPAAKADRYATQDQIAGRFGTVSQIRDNEGNFVKTTYKGFDISKSADLLAEVDLTLGKDKASITPKAQSILADTLKVNPNLMSEIEFTNFRKDFAEEIKNKFATTDNIEINYTAKQGVDRIGIARQTLALQRRAEAWKQKKENKGKSIVTIKANEDGIPVRAKQNGSVAFSFPAGAEVKVGNLTLDQITIDDKTKAISFTGTEAYREEIMVKGKPEFIKSFRKVIVTDGEIIGTAVRSIFNPNTEDSFDNAQDLSDFLENKVNAQVKKAGLGSLSDLPELQQAAFIGPNLPVENTGN